MKSTSQNFTSPQRLCSGCAALVETCNPTFEVAQSRPPGACLVAPARRACLGLCLVLSNTAGVCRLVGAYYALLTTCCHTTNNHYATGSACVYVSARKSAETVMLTAGATGKLCCERCAISCIAYSPPGCLMRFECVNVLLPTLASLYCCFLMLFCCFAMQRD